ncbi:MULTISPECIES: hypothetical protein [unclassified Streptomyces]|uniref:hypothetical protein n=1 Tax=unclassified Streptomyces TaxID=2593676 RepID=UPI0032D599D3
MGPHPPAPTVTPALTPAVTEHRPQVVEVDIGKRIPMVTMPCANAAYVQHPQFERSIGELRLAGVNVLYGEGGFMRDQPGQEQPGDYPWEMALVAVREAGE